MISNSPKLLLSRLPSTLRFLPFSSWKNQGTRYVLVRHTVAVRVASFPFVGGIIQALEGRLFPCILLRQRLSDRYEEPQG